MGASCWTLTVVYFVVQPMVAAAWEVPQYDFSFNTISDLGVTECGSYPQLDERVVDVCSPRHALMNTTFVVVGLLTGAGAALTRAAWPGRRVASVGLAFILLSGVGGSLVGLAPANVNIAVHAVGALLQVPGAVGPLLLGVAAWGAERRLAVFSLVSGAVGSAACLLYFGQIYIGLGPGGMERLAFDPLRVWMIAVGALLLWRSIAGRRG
ncbi:MAG: DUF998 domain-containing protein [Thermoleophilaceae bacterium]|nr:DUF998 domain-containing protein [Thermoleophilaceae bacterium]